MQPITILVCALGGEGGGVLSEWLYDAAVRAGHDAQCTSIPGVAQRTGATTYYVEVAPAPRAELGGRQPVFSLNPVPGGIDLLASSELLETARQLAAGMVSAERTLVISAATRALTVAEKMQLGDGRVPNAMLVAALMHHARRCELLDLAAIARECGTVISAVLLGAIAASGVLPFPRAVYEDAIRASGKGVEASLRGFVLAFDALVGERERRAPVEAAATAAAATANGAPLSSAELRALARRRVAEYQDEAYARLFDERLDRVVAAERAADPDGARGGATAHEVARWLALWMAFDDVARVAALKLAASRAQRVRREVGADADEIVKVFDHFKPGAAEIAGLLPPALARRLLAWDRARVAAGREPFALPLRLGSHTVTGALLLRGMAALKALRRHGSRFGHEQASIEQWLGAVERGLREHGALGHELARCGRLVRGYGSTNERGRQQLLHIVEHLAFAPRPAGDRADAVRAANAAATADDAGRALDATLAAHGAPRRPVAEQVLRFYRRRPAS